MKKTANPIRYVLDMQPKFNADEREFADLDIAWAHAALAFRTGMRFGNHGELCMMSFDKVHAELEGHRKHYYEGNTLALLHAVQRCGEESVPLPWWLALAFKKEFAAFLKNGTRLDKVFYSPNLATTPKRAAKDRRDWQKGGALWAAVCVVAEKHTGLDGALREVLADPQFNWIGLTDARALVKLIDQNQHDLTGGRHKLLSHFFKKSRKRAKSDQ